MRSRWRGCGISETSPRPAIPTTSTSPAKSSAAATTSGASARQIVHQGAQNHSTVSRPSRESAANSPPASRGAVKSAGACPSPAASPRSRSAWGYSPSQPRHRGGLGLVVAAPGTARGYLVRGQGGVAGPRRVRPPLHPRAPRPVRRFGRPRSIEPVQPGRSSRASPVSSAAAAPGTVEPLGVGGHRHDGHDPWTTRRSVPTVAPPPGFEPGHTV
jgi:hypothetical protein